jgi:hypothetical protein
MPAPNTAMVAAGVAHLGRLNETRAKNGATALSAENTALYLAGFSAGAVFNARRFSGGSVNRKLTASFFLGIVVGAGCLLLGGAFLLRALQRT